VLRVAVVACVLAGACAPVVDTPETRSRSADVADGDRLSAQLAALPGAWSAHATLHRAFRDPLTGQSSPAAASALIVVEAAADRAELQRAAGVLVRAAAPDVVAPAVIVVAGAPRPELASVGPFRVARGSRGLLVATLAAGLVAIAGLAIALARVLQRQRGTSAQ
jgi:hypothetical protein